METARGFGPGFSASMDDRAWGAEELWPGGPRYIQEPGLFPLSSDTAWLGSFLRFGGVEQALDLGCGGGALSLQMLGRRPGLRVTGVDILPRAAERTRLNGALNGWEIRTVCGDIRELDRLFPAESFDLAAGNLPYYPDSSPGSSDLRRDQARRESCPPGDLCRAAARVLRTGGRFALVYPPERLTDLMTAMRAAGLEPKRLRLVQKREKPPCAVLLEGRKGAKPGLEIEPTLPVGEE